MSPFERFFESCGIPPLPGQPGASDPVLSDEDWRSYSLVANSWENPLVFHDGVDAREEVTAFLGHLLVAVLTADEALGYFEVGGRPYVRNLGTETEVTPDRLRHWWWTHTLVTDREAARAFLAAAPAWAREQAADFSADSWATSFGDLTEGFEPDD